jgi:ATPase subunit of ABC transporter with duplicated ATPase domains
MGNIDNFHVTPPPPTYSLVPHLPSPGDLEPTAGESRRSHKLRIGRYNQHFVDALAFDENPVEYLMNKFPEVGLKPEGMRAMLGRFGLSGHHHLTPIVKLSGKHGLTSRFFAVMHASVG